MSHIHFSYPGSCAMRFGVRWLGSAFTFGSHANTKRRPVYAKGYAPAQQAAALQKPVCDGLERYASLTALLGLLFFSGPAFAEPVQVVVSVLPQKFILERVGGEYVKVTVLVGPGKSPATYEPTPRQISALSKADVYFRIGVPFENSWQERIRSANRSMEVSDMRIGVSLNMQGGHTHAPGGPPDAVGMDPHIWTDPLRVKVMSGLAASVLSALDPEHRDAYRRNFEDLSKALELLDQEIREILTPLPDRRFMVFHPAWGYFAERYGMQQIAIEHLGKEPGAQQMAKVINRARADGVKSIFVQPQFRSKDARAIARAIGATLVEADPLSEDYLQNMRRVARAIAQAIP